MFPIPSKKEDPMPKHGYDYDHDIKKWREQFRKEPEAIRSLKHDLDMKRRACKASGKKCPTSTDHNYGKETQPSIWMDNIMTPEPPAGDQSIEGPKN